MSLRDSLFSEDVEHDVTVFVHDKARRRALVFPPVNNYRRYVIHQLIQDRFSDTLSTFSIGQGSARRTVVCYKSDLIRDSDAVPNASECDTTEPVDAINRGMRVQYEGQPSPSTSPKRARLQRQVKSIPAVEIYRPPAARRIGNCSRISDTPIPVASNADPSLARNVRQRRPDRAVYVPRHRRSLEAEESRSRHPTIDPCTNDGSSLNGNVGPPNHSDLPEICRIRQDTDSSSDDSEEASGSETRANTERTFERSNDSNESNESNESKDYRPISSRETEDRPDETDIERDVEETTSDSNESDSNFSSLQRCDNQIEINETKEAAACSREFSEAATTLPLIVPHSCSSIEEPVEGPILPDILIISDTPRESTKQSTQIPAILVAPVEKKVKKVERQKSKPAPPPSPPLKINREECDWDSLFDDNGDCLDPTLIEELTSAVGEVMIEQPKNDYKTYSKEIQVATDEFAHVVEIYNFPSEFKTSDLAAVFSPFKTGGFELKWVDDTHCLGVFSSPLIAAQVLASNHPFVKTRPLNEATALSKTKARRSAEFLQPYRNRPETCAALARRLVTGALGVKLATARQEREHEKNVLREAKEKRRLANKQREDVWEGIIPEK